MKIKIAAQFVRDACPVVLADFRRQGEIVVRAQFTLVAQADVARMVGAVGPTVAVETERQRHFAGCVDLTAEFAAQRTGHQFRRGVIVDSVEKPEVPALAETMLERYVNRGLRDDVAMLIFGQRPISVHDTGLLCQPRIGGEATNRHLLSVEHRPRLVQE